MTKHKPLCICAQGKRTKNYSFTEDITLCVLLQGLVLLYIIVLINMCKLWIWTIHRLRCSKRGAVLDLRIARTIHGLETLLDLWITQLQYSIRICITFDSQLQATFDQTATHALALSNKNPQKSNGYRFPLLLMIIIIIYVGHMKAFMGTHKAEAKFLAQIEDVTFASTLNYAVLEFLIMMERRSAPARMNFHLSGNTFSQLPI